MRISTCNVNGIRAAAKKGMGEWIAAAKPDVLLLQEVRAPEELVAPLIGEEYQVFPWECEIKGRAGVAVAVKKGIEVGQVHKGVEGAQEPVHTGRWLEVELPDLNMRLISAYLHSGDVDSPEKMEAKYAHLNAVDTRLAELSSQENGEMLLMGGDFNIVHTPLDITNWKPNHNKRAGVLDEEIAYLDRWFGSYGYVDAQRIFTGEEQGPYTWWSQRGKAFDNNTGWRIDYQLISQNLAEKARGFSIDRASSYAERFSDHAPLNVEYALT